MKLTGFFNRFGRLILSARKIAARSVDTLQVMTNFEIGRRIVEHEQMGSKRAEYGKETLKELSRRLAEEFGRGFSERNLENMRKFYLLYAERMLPISQMPSAKLRRKQSPKQKAEDREKGDGEKWEGEKKMRSLNLPAPPSCPPRGDGVRPGH